MNHRYFRPPSSTIRLDIYNCAGASLEPETCAPIRRLAGLCLLLFFSILLSLSAQIPTNGRVARWTFTGNANDVTGNGFNGIVYGASLVSDRFGDRNCAYYFDGLDHILVPHHPALNFDTAFTISVWIKFCVRQPTPNDQGGPSIIEKYDMTRSTYRYALPVQHGDRIWGKVLGDGEWHHVVTMFNTVDSTRSFYVDGRLEGMNREAQWSPPPNSGDVMFGRSRQWIFFGDSGTYFIGAIDDITMYNRGLNSGEVVALYRERDWPNSRVQVTATVHAQSLEPAGFCPHDSTPVHLMATGKFDRVIWSPAQGLNATMVPNPIAHPAQTTTYTVTAYKFDSSTFCIDTAIAYDTITISLFEPPEIDAGAAFYTCAQDTITLGGETGGGLPPYSWEWSPTPGLDDPTAERPRLVVTQNERYQVIVVDAKGCRDTAFVSVSIIPRPLPDVGPDTVYYCDGTPGVELVAEGTDGNPPYSFLWSPAGGLDRVDSSRVFASPLVPTTYVIEIRDAASICSGHDTVVVIPAGSPVADAGPDRVACFGDNLVLQGKGTGVGNSLIYAWSPGTGLNDSTLAEPTAFPEVTTVYRLRVTDSLTGCFDEDEVRVTVRDVRLRQSDTGIDFGRLDGCRTDSIITVTLYNDGPSDGVLESWESDLPGLSVQSDGMELPAGGSLDLRIRFAPGSAGTYSGRLTARVGPCDDSIEIEIGGEKERSTVEISPAEITFTTVPVCMVEEELSTIVLANNGTIDAQIGSPIIGPPFSLLSSTIPATLKAGEELEIVLRYSPVGPGTFVDELRIPFASGTCSDTLRISVRGTVADPKPVTEFAEIDFGVLNGCIAEKDTIVSLDNPSPFDVTFTGMNLPPDFLLLETLPLTIPANDRIPIRLRYAPGAPGASGGSMTLLHQPCGAEWKLDLRGEKRGVTFTLPDTLDFGELSTCRGASSSLTFPIRMSSDGSGDGAIISYSISGPFAADLLPGSPLPDEVDQIHTVTFTPSSEGFFTGELLLHLEPCGAERRIVLLGRLTRVELAGAGTGHDFGTVTIGSPQSGAISFRNTGSATLRVERIEPILSPFALASTTPPLPADLRPGETLRVEIAYGPVSGPSASPVRVVITSPCDLTFDAEVRGRGTVAPYGTIALPTLSAAPGEPVVLDLRLAESNDLDIMNARRFRAEVAFESSLLTVADGAPWRIENEERIVKIEGERLSGNDLLAAIRLTATLGRTEKTSLRLVSFEWLDPAGQIRVDTVHGEFALLGLCRDGGTRLYDPTGGISIKSITPNPARGMTRILYSLLESGPHRLRLIDLAGQNVEEIFSGPMVPGEYALDLPIPDLGSGVYYLVLETPSVMVTEKMKVVR